MDYDALVAAPEAESRALLEACALGWEDACLTPHQTERRIETLSLHQVRQPIHAGASGGWRRYAREMAPITDALAAGGLLP